jgi:hypothetical protein
MTPLLRPDLDQHRLVHLLEIHALLPEAKYFKFPFLKCIHNGLLILPVLGLINRIIDASNRLPYLILKGVQIRLIFGDGHGYYYTRSMLFGHAWRVETFRP